MENRDVDRFKRVLDSEFSSAFLDKEGELLEIERNIHKVKLQLDCLRQSCFSVSTYSKLEEKDYMVQKTQEEHPQDDICATIRKLDSPTSTGDYEEENVDENAERTTTGYDDAFHKDNYNTLITKTVVVGNTSKFLHNQSESDGATHKWMVYLRGLPNDDISKYVKSVWFLLDPSYRPNDCVHITSPPFQLVRRGWGEFPIRLQITFHNPLNKPVDVIHHLALDRTKTGQQMRGSETIVNLALYFENVDTSSSVSPIEPNLSDLDLPPLQSILSDNLVNLVIHDHPYSRPSGNADCSPHSTAVNMTAVLNTPFLEDCLKDLVELVPLIGMPTDLYCFTAKSLEEYRLWSRVKQNSCEWMRAVALKQLVHSHLLLPPQVSLISTKELVLWCRKEGYTPSLMQHVMYCKSCGTRSHGEGCSSCSGLKPTSISGLLPFCANLDQHPNEPTFFEILDCDPVPSSPLIKVSNTHAPHTSMPCSGHCTAMKTLLKTVGLESRIPVDAELGPICYSMLYKALQCFLKNITQQALNEATSQKLGIHGILPVHILESTKKSANMQFLSNGHLGIKQS